MATAKEELAMAVKGLGPLGKAADDEPVFILRGQDKLGRSYTCHTPHKGYDADSVAIGGDKLVRLVFLDESGRSRKEPFIVVAGVIVHGDLIYRRLEKHLKDIVEEFIPKNDRSDFVFHANKLFHGNEYFQRDRWPKEIRYRILMRIAEIPKLFNLPVVFGHLRKSDYCADEQIVHTLEKILSLESRANILDIAEHMVAFSRAEIAVERQMRRFPADEICLLIAEDTDRVKHALRLSHSILRSEDKLRGSSLEGHPDLPLVKIVETPHFASKPESAPLQLADICAFFIMRRLTRSHESQPFFEAISPQLVWTCQDFGQSMGNEEMGGGSLY